MTELLGLKHAALPVHNLIRAIEFYCQVLGFDHYHVQDTDWAMLTLGGTTLSLLPIPHKAEISAKRGGVHPEHLGLTVRTKETVDQMYEKLLPLKEAHRVSRPGLHRDGSYGFYFQDTEGNQLECIFIPYAAEGLEDPRLANTAAILLAHGSRDPRWRKPFENLLEAIKRHILTVEWRLSYMELAQPTLSDTVHRLMQVRSWSIVHILPIFMSSGDHVSRDIPALLEPLRAEYPSVKFYISPALGEHGLVQEAFLAAAFESLIHPPLTK